MKRSLKKSGRPSKQPVMKQASLEMHKKFVTDENGKQQAVILDLKEYKELIEDYQDLLAMVEAQKEPPIPWEEAKRELQRDGLL